MNHRLIASASLLFGFALSACKSAQGEPPRDEPAQAPAPAPSAVTPPTVDEVVFFLEAWLANIADNEDQWGWVRVEPTAKLELDGPGGRCAARPCARAALPQVATALRAALAEARIEVDRDTAKVVLIAEGDRDVGLPAGSMTLSLHRRTMLLQDGAPIDLVVERIVASWTAPVAEPTTRLPDDYPDTAVGTLSTAAQADVVAETQRLFLSCAKPRIAATTGTPALAVALCPGKPATGGDDVVFLAVRGDDATTLAATHHEVAPEYPSSLVADDPTPYVFGAEICIVVMDQNETRGTELMMCTPRP